jgi:hypothetical protein
MASLHRTNVAALPKHVYGINGAKDDDTQNQLNIHLTCCKVHYSYEMQAFSSFSSTCSGQSHYDVALRIVGLAGTLLIPRADLDLCAKECKLASSFSCLTNIEPGLADALLVRRERIDQARSDGVCDRPGVRPASWLWSWTTSWLCPWWCFPPTRCLPSQHAVL